MKHHTKDKGDLGVLKAQADLHTKGYIILHPLTEHAAFDIVAYKSGKFLRVQVKYREKSRGCLEIKFATSWTDKHGTHTKFYDKNEIDLICIYCPETDKCYYIDPALYNHNVSLRVDKTVSGQGKKIHNADNFLEIPNALIAQLD